MRDLAPRAELVYAAALFRRDPDLWRERLEAAIEVEVEGELYQQLRTAAGRALKAPPSDRSIALSALGDLVHAIGGELGRAPKSVPETPPIERRLSTTRPPVTLAAETARPKKLRSAPLELPPQRLPYPDD